MFIVRLLFYLHNSVVKFQTSSSASYTVKGDSTFRLIEYSSSSASSLFGDSTFSVVIAIAFFLCLSSRDMLLRLLFFIQKEREKEEDF